ncbi:S1 RNA-binding domain-containing protein [Synechococcus sp. PCC 7336]|uniref:S1 RNA-binding domain-containing protein n=1 Tax=Synechococcus sp. PCC 7336 TaxID=195250 RepID=UPI00034C9D5F|nr:S1 RNA-binding domain-containing protein [Synechococcus sp. PCC 7336]
MFSSEDFAKALEEYDYSFEVGQVVTGKVAVVDRDRATIDIGGKSAGVLPLREASLQRIDGLDKILEVGEERDFLVVRGQDEDGQITLSIRRLEMQRAWERLQEAQANGEIVQATVTGLNRGGALVKLDGLRGFVPRSHLSQPDAMDALVGETLTLAYLEVNPETNKLVLSEKLARRSMVTQDFSVGQLVDGTVAAVKNFGAFINFEGTTGLLHIKEVSQGFVRDIEAVFQVGQPVKAVIISIDEARGRVGLSTQVLEKSPGEMLTDAERVFAEAEKRAAAVQNKL